MLIYLTLYISECLKKIQRVIHIFLFFCCIFIILPYFLLFQCQSREQAKKELQTLAVTAFDLPGDQKFPLNAMYQKPNSRAESGNRTFVSNKRMLQYNNLFAFFLIFRSNATIHDSTETRTRAENCRQNF